MDVVEELIVVACVGFLLTLALVPPASRLATRFGLVDIPNDRKRHVGCVPLSGGVVVFTCLMLVMPFFQGSSILFILQLVCIPVFLMGLADDRFDLPASTRLLAQFFIALVVVVGFDVKIRQLDGIFSDDVIKMGVVAASIFTVFSICGVVNAMNMVDGIDGLLGSSAALSFGALGLLSYYQSITDAASLAFLSVGVLGGFLVFNIGLLGPKRRIFMGDSGSMLIGVVMVVLLIDTSQRGIITPTSAAWILGLPLLDAVSVLVRRVYRGQSPFEAGQDHMHHILQAAGFSRRQTLLLLVTCQLFFVGIGVLANGFESYQLYFFWLFVVLTVVQFYVLTLLSRPENAAPIGSLKVTVVKVPDVLKPRN